MQNHGPDIVNSYEDVLELIQEVGSPALKACMDINIEPDPESPARAKKMVEETGGLLVHSHLNAEFSRSAEGRVELVAGGYFDDLFWKRKVAYPAYIKALVASGYDGFINWEFCHPARKRAYRPASIMFMSRHAWPWST